MTIVDSVGTKLKKKYFSVGKEPLLRKLAKWLNVLNLLLVWRHFYFALNIYILMLNHLKILKYVPTCLDVKFMIFKVEIMTNYVIHIGNTQCGVTVNLRNSFKGRSLFVLRCIIKSCGHSWLSSSCVIGINVLPIILAMVNKAVCCDKWNKVFLRPHRVGHRAVCGKFCLDLSKHFCFQNW